MIEKNHERTTIELLLVRVEEAARILSLSRSTIYKMMDSGELQSVRWGAARRIPLAALRAWVERQVGRDTARPGLGQRPAKNANCSAAALGKRLLRS
jgi:excisionase family DNA binding protein